MVNRAGYKGNLRCAIDYRYASRFQPNDADDGADIRIPLVQVRKSCKDISIFARVSDKKEHLS